jgi:hypothetical protein
VIGTAPPAVQRVLERVDRVKPSGAGWSARCPAHDDRSASLSINEGDDGKVLLHCFAGCPPEAIVAKTGLTMAHLFRGREPAQRGRGLGRARQRGATPTGKREGGQSTPRRNSATAQLPPAGCTLAQYAEAKSVKVDFLRPLGLEDVSYLGRPALKIPYLDRDRRVVAVQFRIALDGEDRFRWRSGDRPSLYGLWKLDEAVRKGRVTLVEGASDCHTLWCCEEPAIGLPGASSWREEWAHVFERIPVIYVVVEPDRGGDAVLERLATSAIRDRVRLIERLGAKDPSALYLADPKQFPARWAAALEAAVPWADRTAAEAEARRQAAWAQCADLAGAPRILDRFAKLLPQVGVVGEDRAAKLVYLIVTSRLLDRPVSGVFKGPSAAGKSFTVERVLAFFPASAYYALSAMSERSLAYSDEPLAHRILVIYEAAGLSSDFASYLVRSLLSEGKIRYATVEKTATGLRSRLIEREGPTGLLVTTTAVKLHPENETRLFSIPVDDSREQTSRILLAQARAGGEPVDLTAWRALQSWLEGGDRRAVIPYASALAEAIPPIAVRLRRDFPAVLALIRAHALLHQASRDRDAAGRVVATLDDYAAVRELVAELLADGVEATVSPKVRETVQAVATLLETGKAKGATDVMVTAVARALQLDKGPASRRVKDAVERGYLKNLEDRPGRPARLVLGDPLPEDQDLLPEPVALERAWRGCAVAGDLEGVEAPSPPTGGDETDADLEAVVAREERLAIQVEGQGTDAVTAKRAALGPV